MIRILYAPGCDPLNEGLERLAEALEVTLRTEINLQRISFSELPLESFQIVHAKSDMDWKFDEWTDRHFRKTVLLDVFRDELDDILNIGPFAGLVDNSALFSWRVGRPVSNSWSGLVVKADYPGVNPDSQYFGGRGYRMAAGDANGLGDALAKYLKWIRFF